MKRLKLALGFVLVCMIGMSLSVSAATVTFWTQNATSPWLVEAVDKFTKETGIEVELRHIGWGTEELFTAFAGDASPDLFTHGLAALGAIASHGVLVPLESHVDKWAFAKEIVPKALEAGVYNGRQYALPISGVPVRDLFYRADFFEEAGLDSSAPPTHWDDLVAYGRKLVRTAPEGSMVRSALDVSTSDQMFSMFLRQSGGELLVDGKPQLTSEAAISALNFQVDLVHEHHFDALDFTSTEDILTGNTAMVWTDARFYFRQEEGTETLRVGTFPYSEQPATFVGTGIMAMPKAARNKEGALALMRFLIHPEQHQVISRATGQVPFYAQAAEWDWVRESPIVTHLMKAISYGHPNPAHEKWFEIRRVLRESIASAFAQEQSPRNLLVQANERITAILQQ